MGLDALVYCNCFETGRLRTQPREDFDIYISGNGGIECGNSDLETCLAFDTWRFCNACEHENTVLTHHYIGNSLRIDRLREELRKNSGQFPLILGKIIHSGIHCGGHMSIENVPKLDLEVRMLPKIRCGEERLQKILDCFYNQLIDLVECAKRMNKPIAF